MTALVDQELHGDKELLNQLYDSIGIDQTVRYEKLLREFSQSQNYRLLAIDNTNSILGINGVAKDRLLVYFEEGYYKIISLENIITMEEDYYSEIINLVPGFDNQREKIKNI